MNQKSPIILRVLCVVFGLLTLLCLYSSVRNLWTYARMRTVPVEVVRSSLLIDASADPTAEAFDIDYTLRVDLITTDGSARSIHWEDVPARAAYPEEAFDELTRWAPGARHQIFQLRGEARAIRLPGSSAYQELSAAFGFGIAVFFFGFFFITIGTIVFSESDWFRNPWMKKNLGIWVLFFGVGITVLAGDFLFLFTNIPKNLTWPTVVATVDRTSAEYDRQSLPPNVQITPAARESLRLRPHNVITFQWNGATLHGGLGANGGSYEELAESVCVNSESPCRFRISPVNRWEIYPHAVWSAPFFAPAGMLTLFGVAFTSAGLMIRRHNI